MSSRPYYACCPFVGLSVSYRLLNKKQNGSIEYQNVDEHFYYTSSQCASFLFKRSNVAKVTGRQKPEVNNAYLAYMIMRQLAGSGASGSSSAHCKPTLIVVRPSLLSAPKTTLVTVFML